MAKIMRVLERYVSTVHVLSWFDIRVIVASLSLSFSLLRTHTATTALQTTLLLIDILIMLRDQYSYFAGIEF